jgi:hypothetical protein
MAAAATEYWRQNWGNAFTPAALSTMVTVQHVIYNRTFVRVEILSKPMLKVWSELMRHNNPRLITSIQQGTLSAGPCKVYMCYFTSNHMDVRDPVSISCIVPMYVQKTVICFQGLMELSKTLVGGCAPFEQLALLIVSSRFAPHEEGPPFELIFINPVPRVGKHLRRLMEAKDVNFNHCVAGTLQSIHQIHAKKKCACVLNCHDWKVAGIFVSPSNDGFVFSLPRLTFKGVDMGSINLPWATGRVFDVVKQEGWSIDDEGVSALTEQWLKRTGHAALKETENASFLSVLIGIDGIHTIDFARFTALDPVELPQILAPSAPASVSKP